MGDVEIMDLDGLAAGLTAAECAEPIKYLDGWAVLHRDPATGIVTVALDDPEAGVMHVRELAPVDALVAENKAIAAEAAGTRHGDGMSLVARVPLNVWANRLAEPMRQGDRAHLRRWLDNPDHMAFRIRKG